MEGAAALENIGGREPDRGAVVKTRGYDAHGGVIIRSAEDRDHHPGVGYVEVQIAGRQRQANLRCLRSACQFLPGHGGQRRLSRGLP